jgi:Flp pilus assembly protein TadG
MKIFRLKKYRDERGSALVETALSSIILLGLIMGSMEMFMALYSYHYVSYAAREASRWAMVRGSKCDVYSTTMPNCGAQQADIQTFVQGLNYPGINANNITVTASWSLPSASTPTTWTTCASPCTDPGDVVVVDVTYAFPLNLPFFKNTTLNMSSTSSMVITD